MKLIRFIAMLLVVVGALNWGLVGFFGMDLVAQVFGPMSMMSRLVYGLIGLSGLWGITLLCKCCGGCKCGPGCNCNKGGSCGSNRE